ENPCGRRWQGPTTELHRHWWTGPRQPSRRRSLEYASIAARRHRRQGLRQSNSASADQGRRGPADHPEPPQRDQTGLLSEAFLSAAAQDRKLLPSYQGLAAHRHPLRQTCSKFSCRRDPHRRTLLEQVVSPAPSKSATYRLPDPCLWTSAARNVRRAAGRDRFSLISGHKPPRRECPLSAGADSCAAEKDDAPFRLRA